MRHSLVIYEYKPGDDPHKLHVCLDCKYFQLTERRGDNITEHWGNCTHPDIHLRDKRKNGDHWCNKGDITITEKEATE